MIEEREEKEEWDSTIAQRDKGKIIRSQLLVSLFNSTGKWLKSYLDHQNTTTSFPRLTALRLLFYTQALWLMVRHLDNTGKSCLLGPEVAKKVYNPK